MGRDSVILVTWLRQFPYQTAAFGNNLHMESVPCSMPWRIKMSVRKASPPVRQYSSTTQHRAEGAHWSFCPLVAWFFIKFSLDKIPDSEVCMLQCQGSCEKLAPCCQGFNIGTSRCSLIFVFWKPFPLELEKKNAPSDYTLTSLTRYCILGPQFIPRIQLNN